MEDSDEVYRPAYRPRAAGGRRRRVLLFRWPKVAAAGRATAGSLRAEASSRARRCARPRPASCARRPAWSSLPTTSGPRSPSPPATRTSAGPRACSGTTSSCSARPHTTSTPRGSPRSNASTSAPTAGGRSRNWRARKSRSTRSSSRTSSTTSSRAASPPSRSASLAPLTPVGPPAGLEHPARLPVVDSRPPDHRVWCRARVCRPRPCAQHSAHDPRAGGGDR